MRSEPRQQVIRHVTATFEVPVKEEDVDDEEFEGSVSAASSMQSADASPTTKMLDIRKNKSAVHKARQRSKRSTQADDDSYVEDEDEEIHVHPDSSEDDDDDELMMGAEVSSFPDCTHTARMQLTIWTQDNRKEVYGTRRVAATPLRPNGNSAVSRSGGSSGTKRKLAVGHLSRGSTTKARRL
jgi:hypothetical protein